MMHATPGTVAAASQARGDEHQQNQTLERTTAGSSAVVAKRLSRKTKKRPAAILNCAAGDTGNRCSARGRYDHGDRPLDSRGYRRSAGRILGYDPGPQVATTPGRRRTLSRFTAPRQPQASGIRPPVQTDMANSRKTGDRLRSPGSRHQAKTPPDGIWNDCPPPAPPCMPFMPPCWPPCWPPCCMPPMPPCCIPPMPPCCMPPMAPGPPKPPWLDRETTSASLEANDEVVDEESLDAVLESVLVLLADVEDEDEEAC